MNEGNFARAAALKLILCWEDDFLSWNESAYGGIGNMVVPQEKVWRPDIVVGNSVENRRRRIFYVLNIILPVLFLSFMGALVFMLPADAGEKISLAITILLAYIVFLTIVSESMPQTSLQVSILAVYLTVLVAMSALSVVLSILILRIYYKDPNTPVPGYIQSMH
ncbi:acetylcholine receptor subunit beta-like 1 [Patella vulgata]|uniref:acetylcholine receptor subunit beta-like 1 n=1 Tax=Patella vulgata TaxID=6465 RepID=UPI0024A98740|nr:acetylcholine receptor subunit beta-like 1 [Patella vulgata]